MSIAIRLAAWAAAVVLLSAVVGLSFRPGPGTGSGSAPATAPAPTMTSTPTSTPIPLPVDSALTVPRAGVYLAGTPFPIPVAFTLPAGWAGKVGGPYATWLDKGGADTSGGWLPGTGGAEILFSLSQRLFADPCHDRGFLDPQPGPTVDDLVTALADLPGFDVTTPTDVTIDGYHGKQLTLTAPADFGGCAPSPDGYALWQLPLGAVVSFTPRQRLAVSIIDVDGERLVISRQTQPETSAQDLADVQEILDSIRIERSN